MAIFKARFNGTCSKCGKTIVAGKHFISWTRMPGKTADKYHVDCENPHVGIASRTTAEIGTVDSGIPDEPITPAPMDELSVLRAMLEKLEAKKIIATCAEPEPEITVSPKVSAKVSKSDALDTTTKWWDVLAQVITHVDRVLLVGLPGTGKSRTACEAAEVQHRVTMTETTPVEHLLGQFQLIKGETVWMDGPVTKAMREGSTVLLDEIDRTSPEVQSILYALLDDQPHANLPNGEELVAEEGFKTIMTSNEGMDTLPPAVQDRIQVIIPTNEPHPKALEGVEKHILEVTQRWYAQQPKQSIALTPSVRRGRTYTRLVESKEFDSRLAAWLVYGPNAAAEIASCAASISSQREGEVNE